MLVLVLLAVVALYFWAPLAKKWMGGKPKADAIASEAESSDVTVPSAQVPTEKTVRLNWQDLVAAIDSDLRMKTAVRTGVERDPFSASTTASAASAWPRKILARALSAGKARGAELLEWRDYVPAWPVQTASVPEVSPEQAGLKLATTLVGPHKRVALINGKAYREGSPVVAMSGNDSITFQLTEVHARRVVLQRDGKRYELKLPGPRLQLEPS